jgi:Alpha/beta hydrolase family
VGHHVALSVVGTDRLQGSGYFRAKLAQEEALKAAAIPVTILRATQFFEFIGRIADFSTAEGTVMLPPILIQPEAADDVAAALADIAQRGPVNGTVELAGPVRFRLDELVRHYLSGQRRPSSGDHRPPGAVLRTAPRCARPPPRREPPHRHGRLRGLAQPVHRHAGERSALPAGRSFGVKPTIVLVQGAFAESASWGMVIESLAGTGYRVIAAANPLRGLAADAAAVTDLVRTIDGPVMLVGHSYGGMVISNVPADAGEITPAAPSARRCGPCSWPTLLPPHEPARLIM